MTAQVPQRFCVVAFSIFCIAIACWIKVSPEEFNGEPGRQGDDVYFENIAFNLSKSRGITFDFSDSEWRKPYQTGNDAGKNDWVLAVECKGTTTARSPGLPILASFVYRTIGRNWLAIRIFNGLLLSLGLTLVVSAVYKHAGAIAGWLATTTLAFDYLLLQTAGQFMTEAPGATVICFILFGCVQVSSAQRKTDKRWIIVGLFFGIGILIRANLNAWFLLIIAFAVCVAAIRPFMKLPVRPLLSNLALFSLGVLLIALPWWTRNCIVTQSLSPFGTSGTFGLSGAYCDEAYDHFGNWSLPVSIETQKLARKQPGFYDNDLPRQEYLMGQYSTATAFDWIQNNYEKVIPLMGMKAVSHLGLYNKPLWFLIPNTLLLLGAVIGMGFSRQPICYWAGFIVLLSVITTMVTWAHLSRYFIPVRPLLHIASAIGTVYFWRTLLRTNPSSNVNAS